MDAIAERGRPAWQPLTPRGVAAFADAPLRRLLLVQFVFAILAAAAVVWFLAMAWFPTVTAAIRRLPDKGEIRSGKLNWTGESPQPLAENHFLAASVDLDHAGGLRSPADFQVEFGRSGVRIISLLGYADFPYPGDRWVVSFNRRELEPWWGAWRPPILGMAAGGVIVGLMITWAALACVSFFPVWLVGFFANRELNWRKSWKLSGAALMPGALLMIGAIVVYTAGALDLVQLLALELAHVVIGWGCAVAAVFCRPKLAGAGPVKGNPFSPSAAHSAPAGGQKDETRKGPFA